jgi:O-antigen ligase
MECGFVNVPIAKVVRIQRVARDPSRPPGLPSTPEVIAVDVSSQHRIPRAVHWCLLLYVLSISYEYIGLPGLGPMTFTRVTGLLFFATYCFYYNPLLALWPSPSRACRWFLAYLAIYCLNGLFFLPETLVFTFFFKLLTLLQLVIFFWLAVDLCKDEKIMRQVLLTYAIALSVLAVGMVLQLPAFAPAAPAFQESAGEMERASVLGYSGNTLSTMWAFAIVALVGFCLHPAYTFFTKLLWGFFALPMLAAIAKTGSRAGMAGLLIGLLVYAMPHSRARRKLCTLLLALLGIAATAYFIMNTPSATQRWEQAVYEGDLAGREYIVPAALKMFLERPLLGWQPITYERELGRRTGASKKDAHNLFLTLILEGGIVGTVPFLMGLWRCAQTAWQARAGRLGLLPLAVLITVLVAALAQPFLVHKWFWLALICAASSLAAGHAARPRVLLIRRSLGNEA